MSLSFYSILIFSIFCFSYSIDSNSCGGELSESFVQDDSQSFGINFENDTIIDEAMDALNTIQITGDGGMKLYLTFPNIHHNECQGVVRISEISQEEFRDALLEVMAENNLTLTEHERSKIAATASKPRGIYTVKTCGSTTEGETPRRKGTWIIMAIFGRSDLLINW
ncbi:hypothetical protein [Aureispira anguillae]|uniref:Uncharacterized protein n=1 Tax=Aureispira anguillae TaxID=2864201 RepID=A0A915YE92_9BACT|nr:hypothetical protein [Aureispira anguillae]BDS11504.1 hypothetical protein AsAng_0022180 [Aureispira anguillae]